MLANLIHTTDEISCDMYVKTVTENCRMCGVIKPMGIISKEAISN